MHQRLNALFLLTAAVLCSLPRSSPADSHRDLLALDIDTLLTNVESRGLRLVLMGNLTPGAWEAVRRTNLIRHFASTDQAISCVVGCLKGSRPQDDLQRWALANLGLSPAHTLMVENVEDAARTAKLLGCHAALMARGAGRTRTEANVQAEDPLGLLHELFL